MALTSAKALAARAAEIKEACINAGVVSEVQIAAVISAGITAEACLEIDGTLDKIRHELDYIGGRLDRK